MQAGDAFVLDATAREEQAADQACHIAVDPSGAICSMFMGNKAAITPFALQVRAAAVLGPVSSLLHCRCCSICCGLLKASLREVYESMLAKVTPLA